MARSIKRATDRGTGRETSQFTGGRYVPLIYPRGKVIGILSNLTLRLEGSRFPVVIYIILLSVTFPWREERGCQECRAIKIGFVVG